MHKIIVFSFVLFSLSNRLYGMENKQSQNIIPGADYYSVYRPSHNDPMFHATFSRSFNYQEILESDNFPGDIKIISFKEWNAKQQSELDAMIDPKENLFITAAKIHWNNIRTTCGRNIIFFKNDEVITIKRYDGPLNIKKDPLRIDLIKPHSLLDNIKKVEEWDDALPLQEIISLFYRSYSYPYLKKYIEYNDDGTSRKIVTRQHRFIQKIYCCSGMVLFCVLYYFIKSISK